MAQVKILRHDETGRINVFGFYTHEFTRGWALGSHAGLLSAAAVDTSRRRAFPLLGDSASKCMEAVLFFLPPAGDSSSSSSSSSLEAEHALEPSDIVSEVLRQRRPPQVFLASFSVFFFGALYGAGSSIFVRSGPAGSSGNGTGQWIRPAFFVHP